MEATSLLVIGLACIIAAIVGGGLKLMHIEMPALNSVPRQLLLAAVGIVIVVASVMVDGDPSTGPTAGNGAGGTTTEPDRPQVPGTGSEQDTRSPDVSPRGETTLEFSPDRGPAGTTVTVSGAGFQPGERVRIRFHTRQIADARADDDGRFQDVSAEIPADWPFTGQFDVVATGESSLRSTHEPFEVE